MSAYPFQTVDHDASVSAEAHPSDDGAVLLSVDVGDRVHVDLPLWADDARQLAAAILAAVEAADD